MYGLLADHNCEGHVEALLRVCRSERWREFWTPLRVRLCTFDSLGIAWNLSDAKLWNLCQQKRLYLITANRNSHGIESLQQTIHLHGAPESLPVLTLGKANRIITDPSYEECAAIRLLEILSEPDLEKGTGRLFLPPTAEVEEIIPP